MPKRIGYITVGESAAIAMVLGEKSSDSPGAAPPSIYDIRDPDKRSAAFTLADLVKSIDRP